MTDYLQPDFYRFNSDSLQLINFLRSKALTASSILDIGAGCGILGIELARHFKPDHLVLLELQPEFSPFLQRNLELFLPNKGRVGTVFSALGEWENKQKFELIVCNPPYYLPHRGEPSQDARRSQCRTFERDGWPELIVCIEKALAPGGHCFIVLKDDPMILKEFEKQRSALTHSFHQLQGTVIIELTNETA